MALRASMGLALHATGARAVVMRETAIVASATASFNGSERQEGLLRLLRDLANRSRARQVSIALAPSLMPVRLVPHVGSGDDHEGLFVVPSDTQPHICAARRRDVRMVVAVDRELAREILSAVAEAGLRCSGLVPVALSIAASRPLGRVELHDGPVTVQIVAEPGEGWPRTVRRRALAAREGACDVEIDDAAPFTWLDAIGAPAAVAQRACVVRPTDLVERSRHPVNRLALPAAVMSLVAALAAPVGVTNARVRAYESFLRAQSSQVRAQEAQAARMRALAIDFAQLREFAGRTDPMLLRLSRMTRGLPPDVFAMSLQLDSADLQVTVRGRDAGRVAGSIAAATGCANASVVGAISHETFANGIVQRATIACREAPRRAEKPSHG